MPSKPKSTSPRSARERMRARLRAAGLRPVQHWVPDLRDPRMLAAVRREAAELDQHPENDAIGPWIEAVVDPADWS